MNDTSHEQSEGGGDDINEEFPDVPAMLQISVFAIWGTVTSVVAGGATQVVYLAVGAGLSLFLGVYLLVWKRLHVARRPGRYPQGRGVLYPRVPKSSKLWGVGFFVAHPLLMVVALLGAPNVVIFFVGEEPYAQPELVPARWMFYAALISILLAVRGIVALRRWEYEYPGGFW